MQFKQQILPNTCYCLYHEKDNRHENAVISVRPHAGKFDIVSSDHSRTQRRNFLFDLGKFGPKNQNRQFMLKFDIFTNSNMQNLTAMFTFSVFDRKYSFFWQIKSQNLILFKMKFGTQTTSNTQSSMVMFTFSDFDCKTQYKENLSQKIKIFSLS